MTTEKIHNPSEFLKSILERKGSEIRVDILEHHIKTVDGLVKVNGNPMLIEFKQEINPQNVLGVENQLLKHSSGEYLMAMANYITPKAMQLLIEKKINYLDRAGNMYLKLPEIIIRIEGNSNDSVVSTTYKHRAFTKTGALVVFQFLMDPKLVNAPQRLIAEYAGVSLGTIPKVFEGLRKEGFIVKLNEKEWQLVDYQKLLARWVEVLRDKILPTNYIQQYTPAIKKADDLLTDGGISGETQWGGEPAAAFLTAYLTPEKYTLFTANKAALTTKYKLMPTPTGEIAVYHKFWNHSTYNEECVHPILVYAQLMATGDSRNIETAEIIFNGHIKPNV